MTTSTNRLCVISVSDYEAGEQKNWQDELALLEALSNQDIDEDFDVVLVESTQVKDQPVPDQLYLYIPQLKILYYDSIQSAVLKDYGVSQCPHEYIAVLESDCTPTHNWLRELMTGLTSGDYAAASGRTYYGEDSSYRRACNLLHRAWDDPGRSGQTDKVSNNGAIYHREILQSFPYPHAATPFLSAELRNDRIREAGNVFYMAREGAMQHAIGGLTFLWDLQRNKGHQCMSVSAHKSLSLLMREKLKLDWFHAKRIGKQYLRWYDWPLFVFLSFYEVVPHLVGARYAREEVEVIPGSSYR